MRRDKHYSFINQPEPNRGDRLSLSPFLLSLFYSTLKVAAVNPGRTEAVLDGDADEVLLRRGAGGSRVDFSLCLCNTLKIFNGIMSMSIYPKFRVNKNLHY